MNLPVVQCEHWSPLESGTGGSCAIQAFGFGTVSLGLCARCDKRVPRTSPPPVPVRHWGSFLWDELHRSTASFDLTGWLDRMSCAECRSHALRLIGDVPPDRSGDDAWFIWTVWLHDEVNVALGKLPFGLDAARERYGRD